MTPDERDALLIECAPHLTPLLGKVLNAYCGEHERAERYAADARRWRAVKREARFYDQGGNQWWDVILDAEGHHVIDDAADSLAAEQEARDGK